MWGVCWSGVWRGNCQPGLNPGYDYHLCCSCCSYGARALVVVGAGSYLAGKGGGAFGEFLGENIYEIGQ